jgi:hypothetical protein
MWLSIDSWTALDRLPAGRPDKIRSVIPTASWRYLPLNGGEIVIRKPKAAKLSPIAPADFCAGYEKLISSLKITKAHRAAIPGMPLTLAEPGLNDRYVFPLSPRD